MFNFMCFQFVTHSVSQSVTCLALSIFWLILQAFSENFYEIQIISMLNMFTFDVFSVFHSVSHGYTLA